ncbi:MAG: hypothetical protein J3Q66DRAFT_430723 [Benniella sp.]|nr:MAG: hypothetical protein J3Q66DRAFT_430723 [Benniella sp.]
MVAAVGGQSFRRSYQIVPQIPQADSVNDQVENYIVFFNLTAIAASLPLPRISHFVAMPALNDKIFLPISIFVLNIVLAIFKFVLLCAVGAAFAIYSKYGGAYADSVRWTRSAGYLEMIKTTIGSGKSAKIPRSAKIALVVGLFVTVVASFLDKGIAHFVNPAFRHGSDSTRIVVISPQFASNTVRKTFAGWSFVVPKDGNITETMEKALSSSLAIPNAKSDRIYTPVIADYTIKCDHFNFSLNGESLIEDGCAELFPIIRSNTSHDDSVVIPRSPNRWSILMNSKLEPYNMRVATLSSSLEIPSGDQCATYESTRLRPYGNIEDGISSFPTTATSKCIASNGDIGIVSVTSTRFTFSDKEYNTDLTSQIFADTSDELLLTMKETFKTKTIPPQVGQAASNRSVEMWAEVRAMNSSVDILACSYDSYKLNDRPTNRNVECVYHIINVFVMTQPFNPKIKEAARIPNGTNVYVDYDEDKFYAEYEVVDIQPGLEVPLWVLIVSGIILIASFVLWQLTNWIVDSSHTSSLYRIIAKRMASQTDTPVLLRTKLEAHEPLELEGVVLLPGEGIQGSDPKNKP